MNSKPENKPTKKPKKPLDPREAERRALNGVSGLGMSMAVCMVGSFWLGRTLDIRLGTSPYLLVTLTFIGVAAAFKVLFDYAKK